MIEEIREVLTKLGFRVFSPCTCGKGVLFPLWKPGEWSLGVLTDDPPGGTGGVLLEYSGKRLFRLPFAFANLPWLREAIPELTPEVPGKRGAVGLEEEHLSLFPEMFRILWDRGRMPFAHTGGEEALERGILSAFWGALAGGRKGPFGASFLAEEGKLLEKALCLGYTVCILKGRIRSEVLSWDEEKLADAFFALSSRDKEVWKRYAGRSIRLSKDFTLSFSEEAFLRILLAYSPLLDTFEECFTILSGYHLPFAFGVFLEGVSPEVHFFLAEELHRRGVDFKFFLVEAKSDEHLVLSETIQGYSPGWFSEHLASCPKTGYGILRNPGLRALCEVFAKENPRLFEELSPLSYQKYGGVLEDFLFHRYEAVTARVEEYFQ